MVCRSFDPFVTKRRVGYTKKKDAIIAVTGIKNRGQVRSTACTGPMDECCWACGRVLLGLWTSVAEPVDECC